MEGGNYCAKRNRRKGNEDTEKVKLPQPVSDRLPEKSQTEVPLLPTADCKLQNFELPTLPKLIEKHTLRFCIFAYYNI
jgi:hypothetical protein